jgi:hypothetical protein
MLPFRTPETRGNPMGNDTDDRPEWTQKQAAVRVWCEDDATCSHPDHEGLNAAWRRIYGGDLPVALESWDGGDATYSLMPGRIVVIASYPGNSEIRKLRSDPVNGVCCSCGFAGDEETDCPSRDDLIHCEHWWDGPDGDEDERDLKK